MTESDLKQVQCQRTRFYLAADVLPVVDCVWCEDHETYERLGPEHEGWVHVQAAAAICRTEFAVPYDGRYVEVWLGDHPETVFESHLDRYNVYLARDSDRWQLMYSGSHEAFHRVCSGGRNSPNWVDEMFAVLFSLGYLERIGEAAHADRNRAHLMRQATQHTFEEMTADPMPDGIYGRAYLVGQELIEATGWEALKTLAATRAADGQPDTGRWLDSLAPAARARAAAVLGA